ncbi:MAG: DUF4382 domain-containing protein, partial [Nitrososphaerales archaeon]
MKTTVIAAVALLVLAIAATAIVGLQVAKPTQSTSSVLVSSAASRTLTSTTATSTGASSSTTSSGAPSESSSTQSTLTSSGDFAMMATDPPVAASGVTAATATYDSLAVHTAGDSNSTGWVELNATGTINLMSSENVSQTIAAAKIQSGTYDMVRMGVQSASVAYDGQTYAAAVASSNITTKLQSDAQVSASQSSAAVVDLRTFVMNTGSSANPQFVFSACAKATTIPPSQMSSASLQVGA